MSDVDDIVRRELTRRVKEWSAKRAAPVMPQRASSFHDESKVDPSVAAQSCSVLSLEALSQVLSEFLGEEKRQREHLGRRVTLVESILRGMRHAELRRQTEDPGDVD